MGKNDVNGQRQQVVLVVALEQSAARPLLDGARRQIVIARFVQGQDRGPWRGRVQGVKCGKAGAVGKRAFDVSIVGALAPPIVVIMAH